MCDCEPREGGHCEECMIADLELLARQSDLLRRVVDAIRGPHPDPLTRWSVHDAPELAAALVAERDTILLASAKWSTALRDLVEDIDEATRYAPAVPVAVALHRTNCPKCDEDPEESTGLCPRHKAEALIEGTEDGK